MPEARKQLKLLEASVSTAPPAASAAEAPETPMPAPETTPAAPELEMPLPTPAAAQPIEEENPAINEAFTEADVLIKYGLPAKAMEQLEGVAEQYPKTSACASG